MRRWTCPASVILGLVLMAAGCTEPPSELMEQRQTATAETIGAAGEDAGSADTDTRDRAAPDAEGGGVGTADVMAFDESAISGTLVIGQGQEPETLYRYGGSMLAETHIRNALYESIEGLDYDYQPVILKRLPKIEDEGSGAILEPVSVEPGDLYVDPRSQEVISATEPVADLPRLTVEFEMVEGLTWQDGTPVTAEDSVFAFDLRCDPDTRTSKYICDRTAVYEAVDARTVRWIGVPGYTDQTYFTNFFAPLPRHQPGSDGRPMSEMSAVDIARDEVFARRPWSYGPFMIDEWSDGEFIRLARNPEYWRSDEGLPILDAVIHRFIPDSGTLLNALISGDVDVATQDGLDISQFEALEDAADAGFITPHYVVGTVWEHIDFNLDPIDGRPAFGACRDVRRAIAHGTDRETMVEVIQEGKTEVQHTIVPSAHWADPPGGSLTRYPYDPDGARTLLDGLGFVDDDGDGVRAARDAITCTITVDLMGNTVDQIIPAGTPLELTLQTTQGNVMRQQTSLLFLQNMEEIGVRVNLEFQPDTVLFADGPVGPLFGRRFDLGQFAWLTGVQPPVGLYYCTEIPSEENAWGGQNEAGYCNPEYDSVAKRAENTLSREDALPLYHRAQEIFSDDLPVLPLFARVKVMATRNDVVNFRPNPTVNSETWNIETWGFAPED